MPSIPLLNFSKGELGPQLYGRIDVSQYNAMAKRARNVIIQKYGGLAARTGFRFISKVDDATQKRRLIPFQYSLDNAYVLAFQNGTMRVMANGGQVLEEDLKIVSYTATNPMRLEIPFHGYAVGDRLFLNGNEGLDELVQRQVAVIAVIDTNHIDIDVDATGFGTLVSSTGITRSAATPTPPPAPPPPPPSPPPPPPPETGGGGGSGSDLGGDGTAPRFEVLP